MLKKYFITGTDTEVGKTLITSAFLKTASSSDKKCFGLKPIASGCEFKNGQFVNEDALSLMESSSIKLSYDEVNPIALPQAIAPHLAARKNRFTIEASNVVSSCEKMFKHYENKADLVLVEGAGGWLVPLNETETYADVVKQLKLDVILVVAIKLGCINHALLTALAIKQMGLHLVGWVANCIDENVIDASDIITSIESRIDTPCLGVVPKLLNGCQVSEATSYLKSIV